jgi:type I restriction enzyme R subunit
VKELFHVCFWLARTYARKTKPADSLTDASALSRRDEVLKRHSFNSRLQAELDTKNGELTKLLTDKQDLDEGLKIARRGCRSAQGGRAQPHT